MSPKPATKKKPPTFDLLLQKADEEEAETVAAFKEVQGTDKMKELIQLATEMQDCKEAADNLEAQAKEQKARYDELRKQIIPELMKRLGLVKDNGKGSFTFHGGKIHLETKVHAHCNQENQPVFKRWLRENGGEDLIKEVVNAQTLSAFVRERRGEDLPDPPGVTVFEETVAKLTK